MDFITNIMGWIGNFDWVEWSGVIALAVLLFDRLAKLTPSTKDDVVLDWVYKIFAILGLKVPELTRNTKGEIVVEK